MGTRSRRHWSLACGAVVPLLGLLSGGCGGMDPAGGTPAGAADGAAGSPGDLAVVDPAPPVAGELAPVCTAPCAVALETGDVGELPGDNSLGATLFRDVDSGQLWLRSGTSTPAPGEERLVTFTYEPNHYGYGTWTSPPWDIESFDPDVYEYGYSRPEETPFTTVLTDDAAAQALRLVFLFSDFSVDVVDATPLPWP